MRYVGPRQIVIDDAPAPVPFWPPDRSFAEMTVTIVGGGPSHAEIDLDVLAGHRFIAVNSSCRKVRAIATEADPLYFSDNSWSEHWPDLIADWPGPVITSNRNSKARLGDAVRRLDINAIVARLGAFPDHVFASSGHGAACLAAVMGAMWIVLIGFEGQAIDGRTHGHDDYWQTDLDAYPERFVPGWRGLAPVFAHHQVTVLNATPRSAITDFPFVALCDALRRDGLERAPC